MKKCAIITSYIEGDILKLLDCPSDYYVICADGGYKHFAALGLKPNLIIGDFDSYKGELPSDIPIVTMPVEKDDTDTGLCISYAIEAGYNDITIIGGIGGRMDHTIANIQLMSGASEKGIDIRMLSDGNSATILRKGSLELPRIENTNVSLFSLSDKTKGVTLTGFHYPLTGATLTHTFPLGVSNQIDSDRGIISIDEGILLIVVSKDR